MHGPVTRISYHISAPTSRERTPLAQGLAVIPQQYRTGPADDDAHEGEEGVAPAVAEAVVEAGGEEGEAESRQGAHDGGGADGAGGVTGVGVDEEALDALEADDGADGEEAGADVGTDPVGLVLGGPAVDEEAHGDEDGAGDHHGDAVLGAAEALASVAEIAVLERGVDAVLQPGADLGAQEEAQAEGDVVEAADAQGLAVAARGDGAGEQGRERDEHDVHQAVEVHHVQRQDLDDDLRRQQAEGPRHGGAQHPGHGAVRVVVGGVESVVARLVDEPPALPLQQHGRVRLAQEDEAQQLDDGVGDGGSPEGPAPRRVFGDEGAGF